MPPAETPDFDSMSPEEVMAWMESLAKRQGASEGFTTAADVQIAEVDPSTYVDEEPGYVPFGQESSKKTTPKPAASKPVETAPPAAPPPPPPPPPAPEPEPVLPPVQAALPTLPDEEEDQETQPAPAEMGGMAWLESLAADQGDFPSLDLSSLSEALGGESLQAAAEPTNPLDWLGNMADDTPTEGAIELPIVEPPEEDDLAEFDDPLAAGVDPMAWLESLARRQGVKDEELTTSANIRIPIGKEPEASQPEPIIPSAPAKTPPAQEDTVDPAAWLESLASSETEPAAASVSMSDVDIQQALSAGSEIPREEMEAFLDRQLQRQLEGGEIPMPDFDYDPDAPAELAELPDWLLEQVRPPDANAEPNPPALLDEIIEPPAVQDLDLPDWLREDAEVEESSELENIFAAEEPVQKAPVAASEPMVNIDSDDPWVIAFDEESDADPNEIPEWYQRNLNDPQRIAAVEQQVGGQLEEANLEPETDLEPGELEPSVPDWLNQSAVEIEEVEMPDWLSAGSDDVTPAEPADIPDWLQMAEVDLESADIPDWLRETVDEEEAVQIEPETPAPAPVQAVAATPPPTPAPVQQSMSPVPVPAAAMIDVEATLAQARRQVSSGNVAGGLIEYESIIRANKSLDTVVEDIGKLLEQDKTNPALYRVLGDGLMRQGRLQQALDTYRKALNQL